MLPPCNPYDIPKFCKTTPCIGYFYQTSKGALEIRVLNFANGTRIAGFACHYTVATEFINDIPKIFCSFKAVIVHIFTCTVQGYKNNLEFCQSVKTKLNSINVPSYFLSQDDTDVGALILGANINFKIGEKFYAIFAFSERVAYQEMEYTKNGYKIIRNNQLHLYGFGNPQFIRQQIIRSNDIQTILLCSQAPGIPLMNFLKDHVFKADKPKVFENDIIKYEPYMIIETAKWLLDKSYTKFYTLPLCIREYAVHSKNGKNDDVSLLKVELDEALPISKSVVVNYPGLTYFFMYRNQNDPELEVDHEIKFDKIFGKHEITVSIDIENFPSCLTKPVIPKLVRFLPQILAKTSSKIPVIGFYEQSSVICVYGNNRYEFMDSWNGPTGKELLISFDEEKPKFFETAYEAYKTKPSFVVYDILKIMFMTPGDIQIDEKWKFTFTNDDENPILLEFDNFDGEKSAASPTFLMAMILRQHFKAIQNEIGEKPKQVAFYFFDKFDDFEAKIRVENGLKEACKLLKMDDCSFINL